MNEEEKKNKMREQGEEEEEHSIESDVQTIEFHQDLLL